MLNEKYDLKNKINELLEKIDNLKLNNKYKSERINELENMNEVQLKDIKEKSKEINRLKLENIAYKKNYDSLLDDLIKINDDKEKQIKNHEKKLIYNALTNISKKLKMNFSNEFYNNYNIEQLLEYFIKSNEKYPEDNKNSEEKGKILIEKNKRINQLETDLELYREKTWMLSQEKFEK